MAFILSAAARIRAAACPVIFESARISTRLLLSDLGLTSSLEPTPAPQFAPMNLEPA